MPIPNIYPLTSKDFPDSLPFCSAEDFFISFCHFSILLFQSFLLEWHNLLGSSKYLLVSHSSHGMCSLVSLQPLGLPGCLFSFPSLNYSSRMAFHLSSLVQETRPYLYSIFLELHSAPSLWWTHFLPTISSRSGCIQSSIITAPFHWTWAYLLMMSTTT